MKIRSIKYFPQELIFRIPFQTSRTKSGTRQLYYIEIRSDDNKTVIGESAPLPEFGSETFFAVENELKGLSRLDDIEIPEDSGDIEIFLDNHTKLPTVRFAVEQALINLFSSLNLNPLPLPREKVIQVNGLVDLLEIKETVAAVSRLVNHGFTTIKLKAGRNNFEDDIDILKKLKSEFGNEILFRLDINGRWDSSNAFYYLSRLEEFNIEYIEQPVSGFNDLIHVSSKSNLPVAADESVRTIEEAEKLIQSSGIRYLVIKPMLLGGYFRVKGIIDAARNKNVKVILSSSLESNLGRNHLVNIAAVLGAGMAHGLGTSNLYINDKYKDLFPVKDGKIFFKSV